MRVVFQVEVIDWPAAHQGTVELLEPGQVRGDDHFQFFGDALNFFAFQGK